MSVGNGERQPITIEDATNPVIFSVIVRADGQLTFKLPDHPDPVMREILFRGWIEKIKETIAERMKGGGRVVG